MAERKGRPMQPHLRTVNPDARGSLDAESQSVRENAAFTATAHMGGPYFGSSLPEQIHLAFMRWLFERYLLEPVDDPLDRRHLVRTV